MKAQVGQAVAATALPTLLRGFRLRWIVYGAAAYFGLRMLSKKGIFQKQADAALGVIDKGIDVVKKQVGISGMPATGVEHETSVRH